MADKVNIDPRYLKYSTKDEVEALLEKVENPDTTPMDDSEALITSGGVKGALGSYVTSESLGETLENYTNNEGLAELLSTKQDNIVVAAEESIRSIVSNYNGGSDSSDSESSDSSDSE